MTMIVLGLDGGGSKTRVMVADEQGQEIVSVEGGASAVRPGEAEHRILAGFDEVPRALAPRPPRPLKISRPALATTSIPNTRASGSRASRADMGRSTT